MFVILLLWIGLVAGIYLAYIDNVKGGIWLYHLKKKEARGSALKKMGLWRVNRE